MILFGVLTFVAICGIIVLCFITPAERLVSDRRTRRGERGGEGGGREGEREREKVKIISTLYTVYFH